MTRSGAFMHRVWTAYQRLSNSSVTEHRDGLRHNPNGPTTSQRVPKTGGSNTARMYGHRSKWASPCARGVERSLDFLESFLGSAGPL